MSQAPAAATREPDLEETTTMTEGRQRATGMSTMPVRTAHADANDNRPAPPPAKIRVDNLHYDLTEEDITVRILCFQPFG